MSTTHNSTPRDEEIVVVSGRGNIQYGQVPAWILLSQDAHACRVYAILSLFKNHNDDVVYPSLDWIAGALGVTKTDSISKHIDKLVACGAVHRERGRSADGLRTRNRYTLHWLPPAGYEGPMSTRDVVKASKAKNVPDNVQPLSRGDGHDQQEQVSPQVKSNPSQEGCVPPSRGGSVPPSRGGLSKPNESKPSESKTKKTPPVDLHERSVREPAVRTPEDPIEEAPDFARDEDSAERVAAEDLVDAFSAETGTRVETTPGGKEKQKTPDTNHGRAVELLGEAFRGVDVGADTPTVRKKKTQLVDALTNRLDAGVKPLDVREKLGGLSATKFPLGAALSRIESLTPPQDGSGTPRPEWCGQCPQGTRIEYSEELERMVRCPRCHPNADEPNRYNPLSANDAHKATWKEKGIEAQRPLAQRVRDSIRPCIIDQRENTTKGTQ